MIRCYITDSQSVGAIEPMLAVVRRAVAEQVDWIQLREKHLAARGLAELARIVIGIAHAGRTKVLINSRIDAAIACKADGVHLSSDSLPVENVRSITPPGWLIGVSTHTLEEAQAAQRAGADYVLFGPVFESISKQGYGSKQGLETLRWVCNHMTIPVLALGGVTMENSASCADAGAAGIAGISLFQRSEV